MNGVSILSSKAGIEQLLMWSELFQPKKIFQGHVQLTKVTPLVLTWEQFRHRSYIKAVQIHDKMCYMFCTFLCHPVCQSIHYHKLKFKNGNYSMNIDITGALFALKTQEFSSKFGFNINQSFIIYVSYHKYLVSVLNRLKISNIAYFAAW